MNNITGTIWAVVKTTAGLILPVSSVILFIVLVTGVSDAQHIGLLASEYWNPARGEYGLVWLMFSSVHIALVACIPGLFIGTLSAIHLCFYAGARSRAIGQSILGILASIPSVVAGLFTLAVFTPLLGFTALSGAVAVFLMVTPPYTLIAQSVLHSVALQPVLSARMLGYTDIQLLRYVVLRAAAKHLVSAGCLTLARALGEATAVSMVVGNTLFNIPPLLDDSALTLAGAILRGHKEALQTHMDALYAAGVILMLMVMTLALTAHFLFRRSNKGERR